MVIFTCQLGLRIGNISVFHLVINTLYLIHFVLATGLPLIFSKLFHRTLVRICHEWGIVKLNWTIFKFIWTVSNPV